MTTVKHPIYPIKTEDDDFHLLMDNYFKLYPLQEYETRLTSLGSFFPPYDYQVRSITTLTFNPL
jgi:hypothetical protein